MTKTKIVCTIGPACESEEMLRKLIAAGMDVARLNFSHGDHDSHKNIYSKIRRISAELCADVCIFQDLGGPKIRLGDIPDPGVELKEGDVVRFTGDEIPFSNERFHISYPLLAKEVKPGEQVLIDDGLVQLVIEKVEDNDVICRVTTGGVIKSHKGVNLPHTSLSISALTEKDIDDAKFGMELGVDYIALSFVRKASDVIELKKLLEEHKKFIPVIVKIEKQEAVNNLDAILSAADAAMVARGDLGVEVPIEQVPVIQKEIIKKCNLLSKPVITATQMLDSMIRNPLPTRAEVTDVANAIIDGTDAVMLSGETASGKYPVESVKMMDKIAREAEIIVSKREKLNYPSHHNVVDSISEATYHIAEELDAKAIIILTDSGRTARIVSRYRPDPPVIAATYTDETIRKLKLSWGVFPIKIEPTTDTDLMLERAAEGALKSGMVKPGELAVTTAGIPAMVKGSTNMIKVDVLGHIFLRGMGVGPKTAVTGSVCIIKEQDQTSQCVEKGDIIVAKRIEESFKAFAGRLSGIITEEGGEGSYAEYFCEKYGIPGIIGVPGVLSVFFPGQILTIEPELGIIHSAKGQFKKA